MRVLVMDWPAYGQQDMIEIMQKHNISVITYQFDHSKNRNDEVFIHAFEEALSQVKVDFVFSFNYFPVISNVCNRFHVKYVSWVYDSPQTSLYSLSIENPCNEVFLFDRYTCDELQSKGVQTVHHLPLAVNVQRCRRMREQMDEEKRKHFGGEVSFVGSLYDEKIDLFAHTEKMSDYTKGYLEAILEAQLKIQGYFFLEEMLQGTVLQELQESYAYSIENTLLSPTYVYAHYVLGRKLANMERTRLLERISKFFETKLYTYHETPQLPYVCNMGKVDYYKEMPYIFIGSKINLNISLRSIRSGIPQRALDIIGMGGFLLSNYQQELYEYFVADEEFVYYSEEEECVEKIKYYLKHEEERKKIAQRGMERVVQEFNYESRLKQIIETAAII